VSERSGDEPRGFKAADAQVLKIDSKAPQEHKRLLTRSNDPPKALGGDGPPVTFTSQQRSQEPAPTDPIE